MKYKKYIAIFLLLFTAGTASAQNTNFWKYLSGNLQPLLTTWGLRFDGEILPDGATCSNGQILKKTGSNDWDCAADSTGALEFDYGTNIFGQTSAATSSALEINSTGTSTFSGGIEAWRAISAPYFHATGTAATSTFKGAVQIGDTTGNNYLKVTAPSGRGFGNSASTGGLVQITNTNNTNSMGLSVYTNEGAGGTSAGLVFLKRDNALDNAPVLRIDNDGLSNAMVINHNNTSATTQALSIVNAAPRNGIKITQTGTTGTSLSDSGGAILINNTGNPGVGLNVYSENAAPEDFIQGYSAPEFSTLVNGAQTIDTTDTQLTVDSTTGFPSSGTLLVINATSYSENADTAYIHYTSVNATNFIGTAGVFYKATAAINVVDNALVRINETVNTFNVANFTDSGSNGGKVNLKLQSLNPDIEFVSLGGYNNSAGEGKFEIDIPNGDNVIENSTDVIRINGRSDSNSSYEPIAIFTRPGLTRQGMVGIGFQNRTSPNTLTAHFEVLNSNHVGDTNNGALVVAKFGGSATSTQTADLTQWLTGGNVLSVVNKDGWIGIGTTTPNWMLQIASTTASNTMNGQLALTDTGAGTNLKHWVMRSSGGSFYLATSSDALATSTISAFTLNSNGWLGIGTTTPGSQLSVQGVTNFTTATSSLYGTGGINLAGGCFAINGTCVGGGGVSTNAGGSDTQVQFNDGGTAFGGAVAFVWNKTREMLGLGTTTPQWKLQIASSTAPQLALTDSGAGTNLKHWTMRSAGGSLYFATSTDAYATSTTAALTVNSNGYLGVGSTSPSESISTAGNLYVGGTGTSTFASGISGPAGFLIDRTTGDVTAGDDFIVKNDNSFKTTDASGNIINTLYVNSSNDAHFMPDLTGAVDSAFMLFNSPVPLKIGGSCCGGSPPTTFEVEISSDITMTFDEFTLVGLDASSGTPNSICQNTNEITVNAALTCTVSSRDQKTHITAMSTPALAMLNKLTPTQFAYKDHPDRLRWGFIAEEVMEVDPKLADGYDKEGNPKSLDQNAILALTVKAVQEMDAKVANISVGGMKRSVEENYQWYAIGLLALGLLLQQVQIIRLRKKT